MSRYYTKSHEWVDCDDATKIASVGISNYAQQQFGEIIHLEFPPIGRIFCDHDSACVVESVKIASDIYTPVAGKIVEINREVEQNPVLLNDAAETTWIFKIRYEQGPIGLLSFEEYGKLMY